MLAKTRVNWKRQQPNSQRHALELCKAHALAVHHRSVERIAELMGLVDHFALYKWMQNGRMPLCLVRPFEQACGIDYVTRWMAGSAGLLLIDMPAGRTVVQTELVELNSCFAAALQLLTDFYSAPAKADAEATQAALNTHLSQVAWHQKNVAQCSTPELEFGA